jgi:hypothetical protein
MGVSSKAIAGKGIGKGQREGAEDAGDEEHIEHGLTLWLMRQYPSPDGSFAFLSGITLD